MGKRRMLRSISEATTARPLVVPGPLLARIREQQATVQTAERSRDELIALARDLLGIPQGVLCHLDLDSGAVTIKEASDGSDMPGMRPAPQREVSEEVAGGV